MSERVQTLVLTIIDGFNDDDEMMVIIIITISARCVHETNRRAICHDVRPSVRLSVWGGRAL